MILINVKFDIFILSYFIVLSAVLVKILFEVSLRLSSAKSSNVEKNSAYECGYDPFSLNIGMFDPQFYIVGILFIIFDLELMFLYP